MKIGPLEESYLWESGNCWRISQINGCTFCVDLNSAIGLRRGVNPEKLAAVAEFEANPFSDREKAALAYAEAITYSGRQPTPAHFEQLRRHFDEDGIIELTGLIAFQNLSSKFNAALGGNHRDFALSYRRWETGHSCVNPRRIRITL